MTFVEGVANIHNTISAQTVREIENEVVNYVGEAGKLTKFLSLNKDGKAKSINPEWIVSEHLPNYTTIRVTNNSSALTIELTAAGIFGVGDIIQHESGETARVLSVNNNATTPSVTLEARSRGDVAAGTWTAGEAVHNLGGAKDDGDDISEARINTDTIYENYVQTYFESFKATGTELTLNANGMIYGGDWTVRKRKEVLTTMMEQMDMNAMFGEAALSAGVGSDTVRTLGGFRWHSHTDNRATIATLNEAALQNYIADRPALRLGEGGDKLTILCSDRGAVGLNTWTTSKIQLDAGKDKYGFAMAEYVTPIGSVNIMPHYQLSKSGAFDGLFFFLNPSQMKKMVFRPLTTYLDVDTGMRDIKVDAFLGAHSFAWGHPKHQGEINGVTAYA